MWDSFSHIVSSTHTYTLSSLMNKTQHLLVWSWTIVVVVKELQSKPHHCHRKASYFVWHRTTIIVVKDLWSKPITVIGEPLNWFNLEPPSLLRSFGASPIVIIKELRSKPYVSNDLNRYALENLAEGNYNQVPYEIAA